MKNLRSLISQYAELHRDPAVFRGGSLNRYAVDIGKLVRATGARTLLDYGSGKGMQYAEDMAHLAWGGILPHLYDPAIPGLDTRPEGRFHGVICTDVLEHVPEVELRAVLEEIFWHAERFVFLSIATRAANRHLPDGQNAHVTIKPERWWRDLITPFVAPLVKCELRFEN